MVEREPTTFGEIGIILGHISSDLKGLRQEVVTKSEFESEKTRTREEIADVRSDQREWSVESRGEHVRLDAKIEEKFDFLAARLDLAQEKQAMLEQQSRSTKSQRLFQIISGVVLALLAFALGLASQMITGGAG